ncbi:hypothetical protein CRYUN_Cryun33cG0046700 [Craigia yunnanensis]
MQARKYTPFTVVESNGDKLSGSTGFNTVAGYIFGKNSTMEKIPMTTPVFTQVLDPEISEDIHPNCSSIGERYKQSASS